MTAIETGRVSSTNAKKLQSFYLRFSILVHPLLHTEQVKIFSNAELQKSSQNAIEMNSFPPLKSEDLENVSLLSVKQFSWALPRK